MVYLGGRMKKGVQTILKGIIPDLPIIVCKDRKAEMLVRTHIHEDWAHEPPVFVLDEWPEGWTTNIAVITPIHVLGTEAVTSFGIVGDMEISDTARRVLNAYINLCRTSVGPKVAYRDMAKATGMDRRVVQAAVKELAEAGIGEYKYQQGFSLDVMSCRPDANKARAAGIEIKEY
jgi:hypothetical protein